MGLFIKLRKSEDIPEWKKQHPTWKFDHHAAGLKTKATNLEKYGLDYYDKLGRKGGKATYEGKGFAGDRERAAAAGRKGGSASRRTKKEAV